MIPFDVWYTELGVEWSRVLIKVKVLSGNDFLSCNQVESTSVFLRFSENSINNRGRYAIV